MKLLTTIILSCIILINTITLVEAHTLITSLIINGQTLPQKQCLRPYPSTAYDSPIASIASNDMICGKLPEASGAADQKCSVAAGSTIGLLWKHTWTSAEDDIVDGSHRGPCYVYMAKSTTGEGKVWFKIYESGYDSSSSKFCVDTLIQNKGKLFVQIPSDIEPGDYLLRGEILALHEAYKEGGVQPYVHCAEITVTGGGTAKPTELTAFPGTYTAQQDGVLFDIYKSPMPAYPSLGPKIYVSASTAGTATGTATGTPSTPSTPSPGTGTATGTPPATPPATPAPTSSSSSSSGTSSAAIADGKTGNRTCAIDTDCPSSVCRVDKTCLPEQEGIGAGGVAAIIFAMLFVVTAAVLGVGYYALYKAKPGSKAASLRDKI